MSNDRLQKTVESIAKEKGVDMSPEMIAEAVKRVLTALGNNPGGGGNGLSASDYPLGVKRKDLVKSAGGMSLDDITLDKVKGGQIQFEDIKIRPETLEYQAQIAEQSGRPHVASNFRRAAELTRIPDERVLEIYNALRPYRSTKKDLMDIADELENRYDAKICAEFVREAAEVYEKRNRLKR